MEINGPGAIHGPHSLNGIHRSQNTSPVEPGYSQPIDELDISPHAELMSRIHEIPDVRTHLVDEIRQQIMDGTYETQERLQVAVDRLLDEVS